MQCSLQVIADAGSCQGLLAPQDLHQFTALPILAAVAVQQQVQFVAVQCSTVPTLLHKNTALGHSVAVKYNVSPKYQRRIDCSTSWSTCCMQTNVPLKFSAHSKFYHHIVCGDICNNRAIEYCTLQGNRTELQSASYCMQR